ALIGSFLPQKDNPPNRIANDFGPSPARSIPLRIADDFASIRARMKRLSEGADTRPKSGCGSQVPMYLDVDGWPCACPRKLPVFPDIWEDHEPCPHCRKPLLHSDYDAEQPLHCPH